MINLKQTIENAIYSYQPEEFLPIFYDGELDNKAEFVAYKAERTLKHLGNFAARTVQMTALAASVTLEHMIQN
jgi:hypothetical protein